MDKLSKEYHYLINNNKVLISKVYRTKTQYEYFLKIFMGTSDYCSILNYQKMFLTKKQALNEAKIVIIHAPQPRVERVVFK